MSQRTASACSAIRLSARAARLPQAGCEGVHLHHVGPGREVGVLAVGEHRAVDLDERRPGLRARSSAVPRTNASGAVRNHGESGPTWLGTQSTMSSAPRARSSARALSRPAQPPKAAAGS